MSIESIVLDRLKAEQQSYSVEALKNPGGRSEFDFGYRVGFVSGLERAANILLNALDDERNGNPDL